MVSHFSHMSRYRLVWAARHSQLTLLATLELQQLLEFRCNVFYSVSEATVLVRFLSFLVRSKAFKTARNVRKQNLV